MTDEESWERERLSVVGDEGGEESTHRNTGQRESHGKGLDIGRELLEGLAGLSLTLGDGSDKVLEELGTSLSLGLELLTRILGQLAARETRIDKTYSDLNSSVQEAGDSLHVDLLHAPRGQGRGSNPDSSGDGSTLVSNNGILVEGNVGDVTDLLDLGSSEA